MAVPRVCVLRAPGTNCDVETAYAFELAGSTADCVHLFQVLENPAVLHKYQILCIPGGFSYGDDLGAGVIFSQHLRGQLSDAIREFVDAEKLILGICNGFQVLIKSGLLPGCVAEQDSGSASQPDLTLTWNRNARYTDCWVRLKVASNTCVFLRGLDEFEAPIAHAEGQLVVRDEAVLERLRGLDGIAVCYWSESAGRQLRSPSDVTRLDVLPESDNPNGSIANIAGLTDSSGRILGLMPHPERYLFATQHPQWTRRDRRGDGDGLALFRNAVTCFG